MNIVQLPGMGSVFRIAPPLNVREDEIAIAARVAYCASSNSGLFTVNHAFTSVMSAVALAKHSFTADT